MNSQVLRAFQNSAREEEVLRCRGRSFSSFGRNLGEGASSGVASVDAQSVCKGEGVGAQVSGGLVEVELVVDVGWSLVV